MNPDSSPTVRDDPENDRFVVEVGGELAGFAEYHRRNNHYLFVHTETDPAMAGHGLATLLIRSALDEVRGRGGNIVPVCPFVAAFVRRHPEYEDLVDQEIMNRIESSRAERD